MIRSGPTARAIGTLFSVFLLENALVFFAGRTPIAMAPALGTSGFAKFTPPGYTGPIPPKSVEIDNGGSFNVSFSYDEFLVRTVRAGSLPFSIFTEVNALPLDEETGEHHVRIGSGVPSPI
jgi:hypothetical protein